MMCWKAAAVPTSLMAARVSISRATSSSPAAVTVKLAGFGSDTQTAIATGGDATGDTLVSIEGLVGSAFNDHLTGNSLNNVFFSGPGSDTIDGKGGINTINYYSYDDYDLVYPENFEATVGFNSVDVHLGLNGANGTGAEFVYDFARNVYVQASVDTLINIENVTGTTGHDTIVGNEKANVLDGSFGSDVLDGGFGNDTLIGGDLIGNDTASFLSHDSGAVAPFETNTISLGLNGADGSYVRGGFVRTGGVFHFQVAESDVLIGIENVTGSNRAETINGNELDNLLNGRGGNDTINGGAGNDTYDFRGTSPGSDRYFDSSGKDTILVDDLSKFNMSKSGNDLVIKLQTGTITVVNHFGGDPIETIMDSHGRSLVLATGLIGGAKAGIISGDDTSEYMDGGGGDDYLFGNGGKDHMLGSAGNDYLDGGKGNDILDGGSGDDQLFGGKGHDTFVFAPVEPDGLPPGNDTILDFVHGQDRIDLTAFDITAKQLDQLLGGLGESSYHHGGIFDSVGYLDFGRDHHQDDFGKFGSCGSANKDPGPITIETVGNDTVLSFDGGSIDIVGVQNLHANDFIA